EEKIVKEKISVEEKKDDQKEVVVAKKTKKKDKKRKSSGIKIDEGRSKMWHDKASKKDDDSGIESDDIPLAQKLKQKTSKAYAKEMHK
ncbi:hypothetical protein A2U01_0082783, partial [Trifolium medium]|nr:hypothetical protein [Trifolium medium]